MASTPNRVAMQSEDEVVKDMLNGGEAGALAGRSGQTVSECNVE